MSGHQPEGYFYLLNSEAPITPYQIANSMNPLGTSDPNLLLRYLCFIETSRSMKTSMTI